MVVVNAGDCRTHSSWIVLRRLRVLFLDCGSCATLTSEQEIHKSSEEHHTRGRHDAEVSSVATCSRSIWCLYAGNEKESLADQQAPGCYGAKMYPPLR